MNRKATLLTAALVGLTTVGGLQAFQDDHGAMLPKPGPNHEMLARWAGEWKATLTMDIPGMGPVSSEATETSRVDLNGFWILFDYEDPDFMGMPFRGHGAMGYDSFREKFITMWIDNQSDHMSISEGDYDPATKTITTTGSGPHPFTGKPTTTRSESRILDDNRHTLTMYCANPDGSETKLMTIDYVRKK